MTTKFKLDSTFYYFTIILFTSFLFTACSEDEDDPCADVGCLNGGVCVDGSCNCPGGYSGPTCATFDPCYNVTCLNGGTCANGSCNCPEGYTGSDCSQQKTPAQIRITQIVVRQWPFTNNGTDWDTGVCGGGNPDIFVTLDDGTGVFVNTGFYSNCIPNQTYTYNSSNDFPRSSTNVTNEFVLRLYDNDTGVCAPDDFLGGLRGSVYNSTNGFPNPIRFNSPSAEIDATIHLEYVFN